MFTRHVLSVLFAASLCRAAAPETNGVNAASIYTPVFSNIAAWAAAHTNFSLGSTNNFAGPDADAAYQELLSQINAMGAADAATFSDWGIKYEDGIGALLPHLSPARQAVRAAQWVAAYEAANGMPQFGNHAIEALRLARNVGEDRLLISLLVQIAGEKRALDFLTDHVGELGAGELDALERKLAAMPPGTTMVEAMQMEKAMFVDTLIRQVMEAMRSADTNLFETVSESAEGTNGVAGSGTNRAGTAKASWLAEHLRLTAIVESGGRYKIGFETKDGDSFVLALGRPQRGMEMVSCDLVREEAVIVRGTETALVKLKSRTISSVQLKLRLPTPEEAKRLMAHPERMAKNPAMQLMAAISLGQSASGELTDEEKKFVAAIGGTADGLMTLLRKTSDEYTEWIAAFQRLPLDQFRNWQTEFLKTATPLTKTMVPAVDKCADKELHLLASRAKLAAAITARRAALHTK